MRLVDISSFFSESCGGIKTYYRHKALFLPQRGVDCHFVVPGKLDGAEPFGDAIMHRLAGPPLPGNGHYRLFGRRAEVARLLRRLRPDVVEVGSHYLLPGWVTAALDDVRPRPAIVGFFHNDMPGTFVEPLVSWLPRRLRERALAAAWRFVRRKHELYRSTLVASRDLAAELIRHGVPRVRWVGLGVDVDLFHPRRETAEAARAPLVVAYAGRLSGDKAFLTLLEAWPAVHAATGAVLKIAGEGPQRRHLARFAAGRPDVVYEGCLQRPADVAAFLAGADLTVTPGWRETFSLTTAEALACATPVLAPDGGGAGELVSRSGGGALFRAGDAIALAQAAIGFLQRPRAERLAFGDRGRAHVVEHFAWPVVARRLHDAYELALGDDAPQ